MSLTPSTMLELGTPAPAFSLPDVCSGSAVSLNDFADKPALLVLFICAHCPYVKLVESQLTAIGRDFQERGLGMVAISANNTEQVPADAPDFLKKQADRCGFTFPYLYDETQKIAHAYRAACTPDIFLFDADQKLVYRGQLDDARPGNGKDVTGADLRAAIEAVLSGQPVPADQLPATGCNIKWKPGNEPTYF